MEQRPDILHFLKAHSTPPPREVEEKVLQLNADRFQQLQDHTVPPPPELALHIKAAAFSRRHKLRRLFVGVAATVVTALAALFLIKHTALTDQTGPVAAAGKNGRNLPAAGQIQPADRTKTDSSLSTPAHNAHNSLASLQPLPLEFLLGGDKYSLNGNSLLTTFIGHRYPALKKYLTSKEADNGWRLHLDGNTSIYLSRATVATLRKLYTTRADGSPAREAERTKDRLQKWTIRDNKRFDLRYIGSPLDPIDLADFLFPPLISFSHHNRSPLPSGTSSAPSLQTDSAHSHRTPMGEDHSLTVSYALQLRTGRTNNGIGETYNGGQQTLFDDGSKARLRLATLMRIESIFLDHRSHTFTIVPESAKAGATVNLDTLQWANYNKKYAGATCTLSDDTTHILGYACRRADIRLHNGRHITAWYAPSISVAAQALLEPAFAQVPGLVLRYEYTLRRKSVRYEAAQLSRKPIDPAIFVIPAGRPPTP